MTIRFDDKVAIVTGAGGGLGRQHALEFARRGAKVVVNDLGAALDGSGGASDAANAVVEEIKAEGGEATANGSSVSDRPGVAKMVADTMEKWGRIDILVNNAGILRDKSFHKMTLEEGYGIRCSSSRQCQHDSRYLSNHERARLWKDNPHKFI